MIVGSFVAGLRGELLSSLSLGLNVEILNLGLTEDTVPALAIVRAIIYDPSRLHPGVAVGRLVNIRVADNEKDVLWSPQSDTSDALNVLQSELRDSLARLLLVPAVHRDLGTSGNVGITALLIRVRGLLLHILHLLRLVDDFLNAWVGHVCDCFR